MTLHGAPVSGTPVALQSVGEGTAARVVEFRCDRCLKRRLASLGIRRHSELQLLHVTGDRRAVIRIGFGRIAVGNWPGVTVEKKCGSTSTASGGLSVVDLSGVYSLSGGGAVDESIARNYALCCRWSQPAPGNGTNSSLCWVKPPRFHTRKKRWSTQPRWKRELKSSSRGCRLIGTGDDTGGFADLVRLAEEVRRSVEETTGEQAEDLIADTRFGFSGWLAGHAIKSSGSPQRTWSDRIDRVVLHRYFGVPIFFAVMYLLFVISFSGGNVFLDLIGGVSHALFVQLPGLLLESVHAPA